jgi:micrococcal nuclease
LVVISSPYWLYRDQRGDLGEAVFVAAERGIVLPRVLALVLVVILVASTATAADKTIAIPAGETVTGRCVGIHDGDSITILVDTPDGKRQAKVRLDGIDAPELGQPFSRVSRAALAEMVFERECAVESRGADKYGRTIGRVAVDGADVNAAMLDSELVWHFKKYDSRPEMAAREDAARAAGIGLWEGPDPTPPWDWRKMSADERREAAGVPR